MSSNHHRDGHGWRPGVVWAALSLLLFAAACSTPTQAPKPAGPGTGTSKPYTINGVRYVPRVDPDYNRVGTASWYGGRFHGRPTASGQRYDMNAMTAAHKTLPMGSQVRVTNLANRRAVVLRINDRGPFARGRIIDVSKRAADKLGFRHAGTAEVRVQVVSVARPASPPPAPQAKAEPSDAAHYLPVLTKAMEHGARLSPFSWRNPDGGGRGSIVALTQPRATGGPRCRNYRRTAERGSEQAVYIGRACRNSDGSWRIVRENKRS